MSIEEQEFFVVEKGKLPLMEQFYSVQGEGYYSGKPAVFIFHPNECIKETKLTNNRIDKSRLGYLRETYRQNLKMSNLGINAVKLMDKTLRKAKALDFEFVSAKTYRKKVKL